MLSLIFFSKKNVFEKNYERTSIFGNCMDRKIVYFARFLKIILQKMKSSKIDQWQLGYDDFLAYFKDQ